MIEGTVTGEREWARMLVEVITTTLTDARLAIQGGADRLELVTGILEGGLTPSYGLIEETVRAVDIPVMVMVRPHSQSFHYDRDDIQTMCNDIARIREIGAAGIVIGALTAERKVDTAALERLLEAANGELAVTFHRAFDDAADLDEALDTLLAYPQVTRILTSGGQKSALDAVDQMARLVERTRGTHLTILAGSGLTLDTVQGFAGATGVTEVHFGSGVRVDGKSLLPIDPGRIRELKERLG
ncbi:copper homeostasis protein CutC [Brevibacillus fluminis]|uniref:copper homeostasis protein CutC n=1 Tax=Brevibacillus fluminis TaxID=511487 RepID=UPI003F8C7953